MTSSRNLAYIRQRLATFLTETATIEKRDINAVDRLGVPVEDAFTLVSTDVACRVIDSRNRRNGWMEIGQADAMVDMYRIVFPVGTDVEQDYRITVGARKYHVVEVVDDRSDAADRQVSVKRIRGNDGE